MLRLVLVIFFATSALSAPSVLVHQVPFNEAPALQDDGQLVNCYLVDGLLDLIDGGDANIYQLTAHQIARDMARSSDPYSQAIALAQTMSLVAEIAPGTPGDACDYANMMNAYASGNPSAVAQALNSYMNRVYSHIDIITNLANNPESLRYSTGSRGGCAGGGRSYQFEAAWDNVLATANPYQIGLLNEQYCAAKRLYSSFSSHSNNIGAALSAASVGPVAEIFQRCLPQVANFVRAAVSGGNCAEAAAEAKQALAQACASYY